MSEKKLVRKCFVMVQGIKKRARKVAQHYVEMGTRPLDTTPALLDAEVRKILAEQFKAVEKAEVNCQYAEEDTDGNFSLMLTDSRHLVAKVAL